MNTEDRKTIEEVLDYLRANIRGTHVNTYMVTNLGDIDGCPNTICTLTSNREAYDSIRSCGFSEDELIGAYIDEDGDLFLGAYV